MSRSSTKTPSDRESTQSQIRPEAYGTEPDLRSNPRSIPKSHDGETEVDVRVAERSPEPSAAPATLVERAIRREAELGALVRELRNSSAASWDELAASLAIDERRDAALEIAYKLHVDSVDERVVEGLAQIDDSDWQRSAVRRLLRPTRESRFAAQLFESDTLAGVAFDVLAERSVERAIAIAGRWASATGQARVFQIATSVRPSAAREFFWRAVTYWRGVELDTFVATALRDRDERTGQWLADDASWRRSVLRGGEAIMAVARSRSAAAWPIVERALRDVPGLVAVRAAGVLKDPRSAPLLARWTSRSGDLGDSALDALLSLRGDAAFAVQVELWSSARARVDSILRRRVEEALSQAGEATIQWLEARWRERDRSAATRAAEILTRISPARAVDIFASRLAASKGAEAQAILRQLATLGSRGEQSAVTALVRALSVPSVNVSAQLALRRITGLDLGPTPDRWRDYFRAHDFISTTIPSPEDSI